MKILGLKNPGKIRLTRRYCKAILRDFLPISLVMWIIMLIVPQIHKVSFEIVFQPLMEVLPPAFSLKFYLILPDRADFPDQINGAMMY